MFSLTCYWDSERQGGGAEREVTYVMTQLVHENIRVWTQSKVFLSPLYIGRNWDQERLNYLSCPTLQRAWCGDWQRVCAKRVFSLRKHLCLDWTIRCYSTSLTPLGTQESQLQPVLLQELDRTCESGIRKNKGYQWGSAWAGWWLSGKGIPQAPYGWPVSPASVQTALDNLGSGRKKSWLSPVILGLTLSPTLVGILSLF